MRPALSIIASVVGAIVLLWLLLLVGFAILRPPGATLRDVARILPDTVRLISRLGRDSSLGRGARIPLVLLLGYLALPIDLVPDFIPLIGYADDAILIGLAIRRVIRIAGPEIIHRHWPGNAEGLALLARLCGVPNLE